jgi:hypothetical protein
VNGWTAGVTLLRQGYDAALTSAAADRAATQAVAFNDARPRLDIPAACRDAGQAGCTLQPRGPLAPAVADDTPELAAAGAAPALDALQDYAKAIAAITNAADQAALASAQAALGNAIGGAAKAAKLGGNGPAEANAAAQLVIAAGGLWLEDRRYRALRAGVLGAEAPVATLAGMLGREMTALRATRMRQLYAAVLLLDARLGPGLPPPAYATRLALLQGKLGALNEVRRSDPAEAAGKLAAAHAALATALRDDSRQVGPVLESVNAFLKAATAVHDAFAAPSVAKAPG